MSLLLLSYILVPVALAVMLKNYRTTNRAWFIFLMLGLVVGIAPLVAFAYLVANKGAVSGKPAVANNTVVYNPDGSYTVYKAEDTKSAPSPAKTAFRVIGGLVAGVAICSGLFIVGLLIMVSVSCGGNSKCM